LSKKTPCDIEYRLLLKDGTVKYVDEKFQTLYDDEGMPTCSMGTVQDITKRKQAEESQWESEKRYRTLFEEALDGICIADAETGLIIDCNPALAALVGRKCAELIGQPQRILHPQNEHPGPLSSTFRQHLTEKEGQTVETQVVTRTGMIRDVEIKANRVDLEGRKALQGIFRDITERKQAEEALREAEFLYRLHFENVSDVIYSVDRELKLINISPSVERLLGYRPEELIGRPVQELNVLAPESLEQAASDAMCVLGGERITSTEYQFIARDGTRRWGEVSGAPLIRDGQVAVLDVGRQILERLGYAVLATVSPGEAMTMARQYSGEIDLMVTDVVLPEMSGKDLAEEMTGIRPNTRIMFMSGYTDDIIAHRGILDKGVHFIQKPFTPDSFARKVREVLDEA
jgi:PAS domain S-box-containing protein